MDHVKTFGLALLGALTLALFLTSSAFAHAKFVRSEPAPDSVLTVAPKQVTIWFSEELDTKTSFIKGFDATGAQIDLSNSKVNLDDRKQMSVGLKPLANGVFTVKWHSVSDEDKDELDGEFKFTVNVTTTPTVSPTLAQTAAPATVAPSATATPLAPTPTRVAAPTALPTVSPVANIATISLMVPLIVLSILVLGAGVLLVLRKKEDGHVSKS